MRGRRAPGPTPRKWEVQKSEAICRIGNAAARRVRYRAPGVMLWMGKAFRRLPGERAGESGSCDCRPGQNVEYRPSAFADGAPQGRGERRALSPAIEGATAAGQLLQISGRTNRRRKPAVVHRMRSATRHE